MGFDSSGSDLAETMCNKAGRILAAAENEGLESARKNDLVQNEFLCFIHLQLDQHLMNPAFNRRVFTCPVFFKHPSPSNRI